MSVLTAPEKTARNCLDLTPSEERPKTCNGFPTLRARMPITPHPRFKPVEMSPWHC